jgi:hypothetical protein
MAYFSRSRSINNFDGLTKKRSDRKGIGAIATFLLRLKPLICRGYASGKRPSLTSVLYWAIASPMVCCKLA